MSSASFPSIDLPLRASRWLQAAVVLLTVAGAAALALSAAPAPAWLLLPVLAAIAWRNATKAREAVLCLGADGSVRVLPRGAVQGNGAAAELVAVAERGALVFVHWREDGRHARHVFAPDTCDAEARRRLRLWWRQRGHADRTTALLPGVR